MINNYMGAIPNRESTKDNWSLIIKEIEKEVRKDELKKKEEEDESKMMEIIAESVRGTVREELANRGALGKIREETTRVRSRDCFYCGRFGYMARDCFVRKRKEEDNENKHFNKYLRVHEESGSASTELRAQEYRKCGEAKRKLNLKRRGMREDRIEGGLVIEDIKAKFREIFDPRQEEIVHCKIEKCKIETPPGKKVVKRGQTIPQALMENTEKYIKGLEERKIIRRSTSEWRNPIRAIVKPNGGVRLVSNLMSLNDLVEKDPYELSNIRDIVRATQGSKWFTVIDLKEGFYHVEIEEEDKHKTAFEFNRKVYEWNSMVMGYKNSPQILQRIMNQIFEDLQGEGVEVYMDDIVIHARTKRRHDKLVIEALERLKRHKMRLNIEKIQFSQQLVKLLGVTLNGTDIEANEIKKNEASEFPQPTSVSETRRFLGMTGWFRNFIKNYAGLTIHLTDSLRGKDKKFLELKEVLRAMGKLRLPDYRKEFILRTDASNVGIGAVLLRKNDKDKWVAIQWSSKKLTPTETRYTISEKEMYAVFWGIKRFEYELRGRKFKIETDHKALNEIRKKPCFNNNRINRRIEKIQEFDFTIAYKKPEEMVVADALSRIHMEDDEKKKKIRERTAKQI
ncbi:reverse transcriptase [Vairimorpha necatrix]|uniref:Reverse transcriptase n=1 Tax=Vairimorpha necatrix TaxID=6039 RepID=A0AAX4JAD7_9MICR